MNNTFGKIIYVAAGALIGELAGGVIGKGIKKTKQVIKNRKEAKEAQE